MIQQIPKWKVVIHTDDDFVFYIHDIHLNNVLTTISKLSFEKQVIQVIVSQVIENQQIPNGIISNINFK